jgi:hypothetical protein
LVESNLKEMLFNCGVLLFQDIGNAFQRSDLSNGKGVAKRRSIFVASVAGWAAPVCVAIGRRAARAALIAARQTNIGVATACLSRIAQPATVAANVFDWRHAVAAAKKGLIRWATLNRRARSVGGLVDFLSADSRVAIALEQCVSAKECIVVVRIAARAERARVAKPLDRAAVWRRDCSLVPAPSTFVLAALHAALRRVVAVAWVCERLHQGNR